MLAGKSILLIITGGIAAYKTLDLIRRLREWRVDVRCILTTAGANFVTPMSLAALSGNKVYSDLFSLTSESEMGHIRLSREAELVVVAPATADILAKMVAGIADDLATTALLATDKPILVAPAMNVRMWEHPATQSNLSVLRERGVRVVGPSEGDMACGEWGMGRLAEVNEIVTAIELYFQGEQRLAGRRALVTSGPTYEAIDPVRFIGNRSSGKQGHAIAAALARRGADTTLVTGPTQEPDPADVTVVHIESARQMLAACESALPVDVAVFVAAVSDWRAADVAIQKVKKVPGTLPPPLVLEENPDILATIAASGSRRPPLVIGFAAETTDVVANATAKRRRKRCDWILANDVSHPTGTFGGADNTIHLITEDGVEDWPPMSKSAVADKLVGRIAQSFET